MESLAERRNLLAKELLSKRRSSYEVLPLRAKSHRFVLDLLALLFPQLAEQSLPPVSDLAIELIRLETELEAILMPLQSKSQVPIAQAVQEFFAGLPRLYETMDGDAQAIYEGDPAAESYDEVVAAYPGFFAIAVYRVAHEFYQMGIPVFPRLLTELAHQMTGIDIHPGATIGSRFCIDHGTGIVIGETAVIGEGVKIYQGVTIGALSVEKAFSKRKRHPTLENGVIVYSNATILGGETVIGHDSVIGGNVWITASVPPNSWVYHKSEIQVRSNEIARENT